jgi:hypothetical protein
VAIAEKTSTEVAADEPGAAGDEDMHGLIICRDSRSHRNKRPGPNTRTKIVRSRRDATGKAQLPEWRTRLQGKARTDVATPSWKRP